MSQSLSQRAERARDATKEILTHMDAAAEVAVREEKDTVWVTLDGSDQDLLIGRRGETLDSLQFLVGLIVNRDGGPRTRVVVDANGYRDRRTDALRALAKRVAQEVLDTGDEIEFDPMPAHERRIVHMELADVRGLKTISEGQGSERCVVALPAEPSPVDEAPVAVEAAPTPVEAAPADAEAAPVQAEATLAEVPTGAPTGD